MPPQLPGSAAPGPGRPLATYASVAHGARVYDYLLGGKDNFAADREAAEQAIRINPDVVSTARAHPPRGRGLLRRAEPGRARPGAYPGMAPRLGQRHGRPGPDVGRHRP